MESADGLRPPEEHTHCGSEFIGVCKAAGVAVVALLAFMAIGLTLFTQVIMAWSSHDTIHNP